MKKFNYFLSLLLLLCVGVSAQAQTYSMGDPLTAVPDADTPVFLQSGVAGTAIVWSGAESGTVATDDALVVFEPTGDTKDGSPLFRLKLVSTGEYLKNYKLYDWMDTSDLGVIVGTTADPSDAFIFTCLPGDINGDDSNYRAYTTTGEASKGNQAFEETASVFVLCSEYTYYSGATLLPTYFGCYAGGPFMSPYTDTNAWFICEAIKSGALEQLQAALDLYFPNGVNEDTYPTGTTPGTYNEAAYNEVLAVYNEVIDALNAGSVSEAQAEAFVAKLADAKTKIEEAFNPMVAGNYYLLGVGRTEALPAVYPVFDNGGELKWQTSAYEVPATPTLEDAKFIFTVAEAEDGFFTIQNYATKRYVASVETSAQVESTEEPQFTFAFEVGTELPGMFRFRSTNYGEGSYHYFHEGNSGPILGWCDATASEFRVVPVSSEDLAELDALIEQNILNEKLSEEYSNAMNLYNQGRAYKTDAANEENGYVLFMDPGLVTDAAQLSSNAEATNEGDNGPVALLIDNNDATYFHSSWGTPVVTENHYIQVNLGEELDTFLLQVSKRKNANNNLKDFVILATNTPANEDSWEYQGQYTCLWDRDAVIHYEAEVDGETVAQEDTIANFASLVGIEMNKKFQHIRIVCLTNTNGNAANGYQFFNVAEMRIYNAEYDPENSLFEQVDAETAAALKSAMEDAYEAIAAGAATQELIDALKDAEAAFAAQYPDIEALRTAIANLKAAIATLPFAADDAQKIGNFPVSKKQEALDELDSLLETAEAAMTADVINNALLGVAAVGEDLEKSMKLPEVGKFYVIRGETSSEAAVSGFNAPVYVVNNSTSTGLRYMPHKAGAADADSVNIAEYYNMIWFVESVNQEAQKVQLRNLGTGMYVKNDLTALGAVTPSLNSTRIQMQSARISSKPAVNFIVGEREGNPLFFNAEPGSAAIKSWTSASGADNSAFSFEEAVFGDEGLTHWPVSGNQTQIVTLPVSVEAFFGTEEGKGQIYKVLGLNTEEEQATLEFEEYGEEVIPAGTPFLYVAESDETYIVLQLTEPETIPTYDFVGTEVNGMVGTVQGATAYASENSLRISWNGSVNGLAEVTSDYAIGANSGYFHGLPTTTEKGDFSMNVPASFVTGVANVEVLNNANGKIYDLSGRRVVKAQKGLYIINGQKVLVK